MTTSSPRLKAGKVYKDRDFQEAYWGFGAMLTGRPAQRYIKAGGGGYLRPYPADDLVKSGGYWRWYRPWKHRRPVLLKAGIAKTVNVTCICTTDLAPRPTIRLLANAAIGISEQVAVMPAGINTERTLSITATATATGVAWLQMEWLAMPDERYDPEWCGWGTLSAT